MAEFTKFYIRFLEQLWNNIVHFFATIWDLITRMFYKDWAVNGYFQLFTESSANWTVLDYVAFIIVLIITIIIGIISFIGYRVISKNTLKEIKSNYNKYVIINYEITNFLLQINPQTTFPILMIAIITIQFHNQVGNSINGSIFTKHTATNALSATVSNLAPNSLTDFVFLAIVPSIISVIPQNKYMM